MAKLYECKLVKDKYLYFPQMGMYWDIYPMKRVSGKNEQGLNEQIDTINDALKVLSDKQPGVQIWHPTLFLTDGQIANLPNNWQLAFHPKVWFMLARPSFPYTSTTKLPGAGVWNPVDLLWISNNKVLLQEFNGSVENTANWLGHRFRHAKESEVIAYNPNGGIPIPDEPTPDPDDGEVPVSIGDVYFHMRCPHCGKVIF